MMSLKSLKLLSVLTISSLSILGSSTARAQIAKWTFETVIPNTAGPYAADIGSGSASGSHANATAYSSPAGNGSAHSYLANSWTPLDFWQFTASTTGSGGIKLDWDQVSSSAGPGSFSLSFSTNGSTFTTVGNYSVLGNVTWSQFSPTTATHYSYDLSAYLGLNDASTVYFRLTDISTTSASGGTVLSSATDRLDNFTITGSPLVVPEPGSAVLLGLGVVGFAAVRRLKKL